MAMIAMTTNNSINVKPRRAVPDEHGLGFRVIAPPLEFGPDNGRDLVLPAKGPGLTGVHAAHQRGQTAASP
jgi:hypothetical protein